MKKKLYVKACEYDELPFSQSTSTESIIAKIAQYPWYVGRINGGLYEAGKSGMCYPFGGTLNEVKVFINNAPNATRRFFTWLPSEFVEDDLYDIKNYPS